MWWPGDWPICLILMITIWWRRWWCRWQWWKRRWPEADSVHLAMVNPLSRWILRPATCSHHYLLKKVIDHHFDHNDDDFDHNSDDDWLSFWWQIIILITDHHFDHNDDDWSSFDDYCSPQCHLHRTVFASFYQGGGSISPFLKHKHFRHMHISNCFRLMFQ